MTRLDELDILLHRKDGRVFARIPQLNLYAKGESVAAAIAALDAKKDALAAELEEAGELDTLEIDNQPAVVRRGVVVTAPADLGRFAIKAAIVAFVIATALIISGLFVGSKVEQVVDNIKGIKIGGAQFWTHVEEELDRMASPSSDLPEAKKQKLLADIRAIGAKWRPFVVELQSAVASPEHAPRPSSSPSDK